MSGVKSVTVDFGAEIRSDLIMYFSCGILDPEAHTVIRSA